MCIFVYMILQLQPRHTPCVCYMIVRTYTCGSLAPFRTVPHSPFTKLISTFWKFCPAWKTGIVEIRSTITFFTFSKYSDFQPLCSGTFTIIQFYIIGWETIIYLLQMTANLSIFVYATVIGRAIK